MSDGGKGSVQRSVNDDYNHKLEKIFSEKKYNIMDKDENVLSPKQDMIINGFVNKD